MASIAPKPCVLGIKYSGGLLSRWKAQNLRDKCTEINLHKQQLGSGFANSHHQALRLRPPQPRSSVSFPAHKANPRTMRQNGNQHPSTVFFFFSFSPLIIFKPLRTAAKKPLSDVPPRESQTGKTLYTKNSAGKNAGALLYYTSRCMGLRRSNREGISTEWKWGIYTL
jgi:hypothetical protein